MNRFSLILIFAYVLPGFGMVTLPDKGIRQEDSALAMAVAMAGTVLSDFPELWMMEGQRDNSPRWRYTHGLVSLAFLHLWESTGNDTYYQYIEKYINSLVDESGKIDTYNKEDYNIDKINPGKVLFWLYERTGEQRYKTAMDSLRSQLRTHPRTSVGGFWHKKIYPNQMWLDGAYMGAPFYARYGEVFNEPENLDDVANWLIVMEEKTRDEFTGLLYHGWDESREQLWADPVTGQSQNFWGRAMGWYGMALVDALDYFPENHPDRTEIISIIERMGAAVVSCQDTFTGLWYQVLDQGGREGNYLEGSVSCMFTYFLLKAVKNKYLHASYLDVAKKAYEGIMEYLVTIDPEARIIISPVCAVAGLGGNPYRDGSYEYYVGESKRDNDPKAVGPFIMACLLMDELNSVNTETGCLFSQVGYATLGNGTTGGLGGEEATVDNGSGLQAEINKGGPRIIYVNGEITPENSGNLSAITISNKSDISIFGSGTSGELNGIGILIKDGASNIIIRNLKVHHVQTGPKDCIGIDGTGDGVSNIWIDHCEIYNDFQGVNKDYYDGLFDTKRVAKNITFSWNYVHDAWKSMLYGYSDSDDAERSHTLHHNFFFDLNSRVPSVRYNMAHIFNNYYLDVNQGANSRMGACLRIENNYFENCDETAGSWYSDTKGGLQLIDNYIVNSSEPSGPDCSFIPPYDYNFVLNESIDVKSIVTQFAGVGVISDPADLGSCKDIPELFKLRVTNGTGDGLYTEGSTVPLTADNPPAGYEFDKWTGNVDFLSVIDSLKTMMTIPGRNVSVEATYKIVSGIEYTNPESFTNLILPDPDGAGMIIDLASFYNAVIEIYDLQGRMVYKVSEKEDAHLLRRFLFKSGIYIARIIDTKQNYYCQKIVFE